MMRRQADIEEALLQLLFLKKMEHLVNNTNFRKLSEIKKRRIAGHVKHIAKQEVQGLAIIRKITAPLKDVKPIDFAAEELVTITINEYAITSAASAKPVLGAYGALSSLLLALYDSTNKIALLAYIAVQADVSSLKDVLSHFNLPTTVAHLYGGNIQSTGAILSVAAFLDQHKIKIINQDLLGGIEEKPVQIAINAQNGHIYNSPALDDVLDYGKAIIQRIEAEMGKINTTKLVEFYNGLQASQLVPVATPQEVKLCPPLRSRKPSLHVDIPTEKTSSVINCSSRMFVQPLSSTAIQTPPNSPLNDSSPENAQESPSPL